MRRFYNIKSTNNVLKAVIRNMALFPDSPAGEEALLEAINNGQVTIVDRVAEPAIVGIPLTPLIETRLDYLGRSVAKSKAPSYTSFARTLPRPMGNAFDFSVSIAQNAIKHDRVDKFAVHPNMVIIYPGILYKTMVDNDLIGRGWTHLSESPKWNGNYPSQFKRAIEFAWYNVAATAAGNTSLPQQVRDKLLEWAGPAGTGAYDVGPHILIDDYDTALAYARSIHNTFEQADWAGAGVEYFSVNHEVHQARSGTGYSAYAQYYRHHGFLAKAILQVAAERGKTTMKTGLSDFGNLATYAPDNYDYPATGNDVNGNAIPNPNGSVPHYHHYSTIDEPFRGSSPTAPMGTATDLAKLVRDGKAYVGVGSYQQHTWDNESFFEKNSDGTFKKNSGRLIWRTDERQAVVAGQTVTIYDEDAFSGNTKIYGYVARFLANMHFRSGGIHLPKNTDRQAGFENMVGQVRQFRLDTESRHGLPRPDAESMMNHRAMNPDWTEGDAIISYLLADYLRGWMKSQHPTDFGAMPDNASTSRASVEIMSKAFKRAAQLNWIKDVSWQVIQPKFLLFKQGGRNSTTGELDEQLWRKPIIFGGHGLRNGKLVMWLFWWWPCQDKDKYTDVVTWVDRGNGALTPGYRLRLEGRTPGLDWFELPDTCIGMASKDVYHQFTGSFDNYKQTWRGDYREAKITSHPVAPAVQEVEQNVTVPPTTTEKMITKVQRRYDGVQVYYDIATTSTVDLFDPKFKLWVNGVAQSNGDWMPIQENESIRQQQGYRWLWHGDVGDPGTAVTVLVRAYDNDPYPVELTYTIPNTRDDGTIVHTLWEFDN